MLFRLMVSTMILTLCSVAGAATTNPSSPSVFTFTMEKGEALFVGTDPGNKVADYEQGLFPHLAVHVMPDSTEKWSVKIAINTVVENDHEVCKFVASWQRELPDGGKLNRCEARWEEKLPAGGNIQIIKPEEKEEGKQGEEVKYHRIPFVKVDGVPHSLVVCVGKDKAQIEKAVTLPKISLMVWKTFWLDSPGPLGSGAK